MKWVFKHQDLQMFGLKLNKHEYVPPPPHLKLWCVGARGSETQLQVGKKLIIQLKVWRVDVTLNNIMKMFILIQKNIAFQQLEEHFGLFCLNQYLVMTAVLFLSEKKTYHPWTNLTALHSMMTRPVSSTCVKEAVLTVMGVTHVMSHRAG